MDDDLLPDSQPEQKSHLKELAAAILLALLDYRREYLLLIFRPDSPHSFLQFDPHGTQTAPNQVIPGAPPLNDDGLAKMAEKIAKQLDTEAQKTIVRRIARAIEKARKEGGDLAKIIRDSIQIDRLADIWADWISTDAMGAAADDVTDQLGIAMVWTTRRDSKVRDTHRQMDGQTRRPGEPFESPSGATAMHPGGFGVMSEDALCRCQLLPEGVDRGAAWKHFDDVRQRVSDALRKPIIDLTESYMDHTDDMQAMRFDLSAMAIAVPDDDHPNRLPFTGVLTKVDEPSDNPPGGSNGKRVVIPRDVAQAALDSLALMAIDYQQNFSGHDPTQKIGVITAADIEGNDLKISGFFYASDFPDEVAFIQKNKDRLGFSYEAQVLISDRNANPVTVTQCVFTGAAVLFKDKAAYTTTSISASADTEGILQMDKDELLALFSTAVAPLTEKIDSVTREVAEIKASAEKISAGSVNHIVKPHADAIRACADKMEAAGIGSDNKRGHVAVLRSMADHMEAESHMGKLPSVYQGSDFYYASADSDKGSPAIEALQKQIAEIGEQLSVANTKLADSEKARFAAAAAPERKTVSPAIAALLSKGGLSLEAGSDSLTVEQVDAVLDKAGVTKFGDRIAAKLQLRESGALK